MHHRLSASRAIKKKTEATRCKWRPAPGATCISLELPETPLGAVLLPANRVGERGSPARSSTAVSCCSASPMQDSMAIPGNFGGGSTGPDQIFLGITGTPPSAPGRGGETGGAQGPVRQKPNPQATKHERQTRAARSRGFLSAIHNRKTAGPSKQIPTRGNRLRIYLVPGRSPPAGSAEGRSD
jgi:hypothetical protein